MASRCATWSRPRTSSSRSPSAPTARRSPPPAPTGRSGSSRSRRASCLTQIEDHADWIFAVAFSPDGKRLASASRDKTGKVFDVEKKESLVTFPGHAQPVYTVSFTPDGKGIATGGEDNRIRVWNPDNDGKPIRDIGGFGGTVFKLRYSPDGKNLVACSRRQDGPRLQTPTGLQLRKLQGHNDWVYSLAISRDGKTVASGSWDGEVRLWNLADGKPIRTSSPRPATSRAQPRRPRAEAVWAPEGRGKTSCASVHRVAM